MSLDNIYSQERESERRVAEGKLRTTENALKVEYQRPEAESVLNDLLTKLGEWETTARAQGFAAVDSSTTQASFLQRSYAYETVKAYIEDKLS